jgi:hypothetical protein
MTSLSSRFLGVTAAIVVAAACSPSTILTTTTSSGSSAASTGSASSGEGPGGAAATTAASSATGAGGSGGIGGEASSSAASSSAESNSAATSSDASSSSGSPIDLDLDQDGDGWSPNEGDCCDLPTDCNNPPLINPGAFEFPGNNVDDDCDPMTMDNAALLDCAPPPLQAPTAADDLIKAMDLCQFVSEVAPKPQRKWGVISTSLHLADGTLAPKDLQVGVLGSFGASVVPQAGASMAAISTGTARSKSDPGFVTPQAPNSYNTGTTAMAPFVFLAAHNGVVPTSPSCPVCQGPTCGKAFDSVDLKVRLRVPTNTASFSFRHRMFTAEYPERVCANYNDFFVAMLTSTWTPDPTQMPPFPPLPADRNIAFDAQKHFMSVDNAMFDVCFPQAGAPPGSCPGGTLDLVGNGYGGAGNGVAAGAATEWLIADAPVVPGETIELELIVWDALDHQGDALVLLDKFRWNAPNCGGNCPHP